ncbi:MAG: Gfo/Idh/MocA family oxidoreductase [Candidatus Bathyarchaeota archaeon]|nr:Gfo/Idh/MocA family oxidoreductase [Candidatus Bathyarchaeota archaeon]
MSTVNVAIIGCGWAAESHISAWRQVKNYNVISVVDINETLASKTATKWNIPSNYSSMTEALKQQNVDIIDICTPPKAHRPLAVEAMDKGKSIQIEKPLTMTIKEAKEIVDCQNKTGLMAGVVYNWLFEPCVMEATDAVKKGEIGEVINVEIQAPMLPTDSMAANEQHWSHKLPGGRFGEFLLHPIYILRNFLGDELNPVSVAVSKIGNIPWMKYDELTAILSHKGRFATIYASFNSPFPGIFINIYGTEGLIRLDVINSIYMILPKIDVTTKTSRLGVYSRESGQLTKSVVKNLGLYASRKWMSGHEKCLKMYAESYLNHGQPPVTLEDSYKDTIVLEKMCNLIDANEP